jgi:hypothetical protein
MCLRLYLGTDCDLELREGPSLSVRPLPQDGLAILTLLKTRSAYHIGSHTGCSCGFPSVIAEKPMEYYEGMLDERGERAADLASVRELIALLHNVLHKDRKCFLYPVWNGDESKATKGLCHLHLSQMSEATFVLTEQFVYHVGSDTCDVRDYR